MSEQDKPMDLGDHLTTEVEAVAMMIKLVGLTGPYADRIFPIDKPEFLIGRSKICDLVLEEKTISGKHARIMKVGDHFEVEDMGSTNGVFVNDRRVERQALRDDDVITFDEVPFRYTNPHEVSRTVVSPRKDLLDFGTVEREVPPTPQREYRETDGKDLPKTKPMPDPVLEEKPKPEPPPQSQDSLDGLSLTSAPTAPLPLVVPDREDSGPHPDASANKPAPFPPRSSSLPDSFSAPPIAAAPPPQVSPARPAPPISSALPAPPPPPQQSPKTSPDLIINPYQPAFRSIPDTDVERSGALSSLFTGLTFAVLFSFFGTFLGIWGQIKFSGDPIAVLKSMAIMFPLWHTHLPWLTTSWNSATIITIICLPIGPFLGGLLTQSMWRERPAGTAALFSVIYAMGFIVVQIIALDFNLDNVKTLPQINSIGLGNPALAMLAIYGIFLIVTFVLSLLGTLAGKK